MSQEHGYDNRYDNIVAFIETSAIASKQKFPMASVFQSNAGRIAGHLLSSKAVDPTTGKYNGTPIDNFDLVQTDSGVYVTTPVQSRGNYKITLSNVAASGNVPEHLLVQLSPDFPPRRLEWLDLADAVCMLKLPFQLFIADK